MEPVYINLSEGTSIDQGNVDHQVAGGGYDRMEAYQSEYVTGAERYWVWELEDVPRPVGNVSLGGGDDFIQIMTGTGAIDGGTGFDILDLRNEPFFRSYSFEPGSNGPYAVTVDLGGAASFDGISVELIRSSFVSVLDENGRSEVIGTKEFKFTDSSYGAFSRSPSGSEAVIASEGDDIVRGSDADVEILSPGPAGNDQVIGGDGFDFICYGTGNTVVSVDLSKGRVDGTAFLYASNEEFTDQISGIEGVIGGMSGDTMKGDAEDNVFYGNGGEDSIDGGKGRDQVRYDMPDLSDYQQRVLLRGFTDTSGEGVIVDLRAGTARDDYGDTDTLVRIEDVLGTAFDDTVVGSGKANSLEGAAGVDTLVGGKGRDWLDGGEDADSLKGGGGADTFVIRPSDGPADSIEDFTFGVDSLAFM